MVGSIQGVTKSYLSGLIIVIVILAIMNSVGLLILGVQPAIFLGILAALLNIIPYIGVLIGSLIPVAIALLTSDSIITPILVFAVFSFNQFVENNFLTPKIVGSKISVNPFATIVFILLGGMIWGVGGMILFIPLLGVLKVVFDHFEPLYPWAYLIGDSEEKQE
jgi:predicted PurR-regulated permease PerM